MPGKASFFVLTLFACSLQAGFKGKGGCIMCRAVQLWCTLIFTALAVGIYTDVGHGMEDAAPVAHEWDIGVHSDPINRNAVNVPAQPCRLGEPEAHAVLPFCSNCSNCSNCSDCSDGSPKPSAGGQVLSM